MQIPFAIQSYNHDSAPLSTQRTVNAFAEAQPRGAKSQIAVFGSPGISTLATAGVGPVRGMFKMNGVNYVVSGSKFFSFTAAGAVVELGAGIPGAGIVSMDGNGIQIAIVNGTADGFIFDTGTLAFTQISNPNFNPANTVTFIDGYFAFDWVGTRKMFLSDLLDGLSYDALAFATKESKPDRVLALRNRQNALLVFAEESIETWTDAGLVPFAFQRFDGGTVNRGVASPHAITEEDNAVFLLGEDLVFYRLNGTQPVRISTHALEREWRSYSTTSDAFCFAMNDRGHKFIGVTFPTATATAIYDVATGLWHERASYDSGGRELQWRANCVLSVPGRVYVGDSNSGKIGLIDPSVYTEFDDPIITTLISPPIHADGKIVFMDNFELDIESGVGLTTGQGSNPQIMLDWTDDGGRTWCPPQEWRTMGALGDYATRVQWNGLGSFYQRSLRIRISDPVKRVIIAARSEIRVGSQ